ncbi:MAG: YrhK family protein [Pseudomonadota bacterium]
MPHLFVNRPRQHDLFATAPARRDHVLWEMINGIVYLVGGVLFVLGSVLFFPALSAYADLGAWIFAVGSVLYLVVTGHDLAEVLRRRRVREGPPTPLERLDAWAAVTYVSGTLAFLIGSIFFLSSVGLYDAGAWCFIIGSLLFVVGAVVNVLQIVRAADFLTLQLMNLTALTFVTGSVIFALASIPYLWHFESEADERLVEGFLAWQFVVGSALFLLGGALNAWRARRFIRHEAGVRPRAA